MAGRRKCLASKFIFCWKHPINLPRAEASVQRSNNSTMKSWTHHTHQESNGQALHVDLSAIKRILNPRLKSLREHMGPAAKRCHDLLLQCPWMKYSKRVEYSKCVISTSTKCLPWNTANHKNPKPYYCVKCGSKLWIPVEAINNKRNVIGQHILWSITQISYMQICSFQSLLQSCLLQKPFVIHVLWWVCLFHCRFEFVRCRVLFSHPF